MLKDGFLPDSKREIFRYLKFEPSMFHEDSLSTLLDSKREIFRYLKFELSMFHEDSLSTLNS